MADDLFDVFEEGADEAQNVALGSAYSVANKSSSGTKRTLEELDNDELNANERMEDDNDELNPGKKFQQEEFDDWR